MYGWDSYFIVRGLIEDGELNLARGMVENFFFEIENYGAVLNANRTYYLTRSQPPFLSSMILAVHHANVASRRDDSAWLERAYEYAQRDYKLWMTAPSLTLRPGCPATTILEAGQYRRSATIATTTSELPTGS